MVELLIKNGATTNIKDKNGDEPLKIGSDKGNERFLEILAQFAIII